MIFILKENHFRKNIAIFLLKIC